MLTQTWMIRSSELNASYTEVVSRVVGVPRQHDLVLIPACEVAAVCRDHLVQVAAVPVAAEMLGDAGSVNHHPVWHVEHDQAGHGHHRGLGHLLGDGRHDGVAFLTGHHLYADDRAFDSGLHEATP